jgi:hypothetical protein
MALLGLAAAEDDDSDSGCMQFVGAVVVAGLAGDVDILSKGLHKKE